MNTTRPLEYLRGLLRELLSLPRETEWVEFKHNNDNPQEIGEYISALSNSSALSGKAFAYLVWGVPDGARVVAGTTFKPGASKKGNEELENWLLRLLNPRIEFAFYEFEADNGNQVVLLEISRATKHPVQFHGHEYIRVGSYKKSLKEFPEKERALWRIFDTTPFEAMIAKSNQTSEDVLHLLSYPDYFDLFKLPLPDNKQGILSRLQEEHFIVPNGAGNWDITNFGAILFARRLDEFSSLKRKAVRVIFYKGNSRIETQKEQVDGKGYASGFEGLMEFIMNMIPSNEVIEKALRKDVPMYPELAIRELVANAIIHQDFMVHGAGPMIEIFTDRIEITNPGQPMVSTERFLDSPPRSRNEGIASFLRRIGVCEERGSGIDKVVFQTELYQLPAPLFETAGENTRVVLFAHKTYTDMDRKDRVRATYLHACLRYVQRDYLTNTSLRDRFGIEKENSSMVSRVIRDATEDKAIKPVNPENESRKLARYWPIWA
jgi:predicted HTH transcriptional regulator